MKSLKSLISWVEIPVLDMARATAFYEAILETKLQIAPMGELTMAFFMVQDGGIGGALCKHEGYYKPSENGIVIYLTAQPDIKTVLERIKLANGKVIMEEKLISPTSGSMAMFLDTEGNRIALYDNSKLT